MVMCCHFPNVGTLIAILFQSTTLLSHLSVDIFIKDRLSKLGNICMIDITLTHTYIMCKFHNKMTSILVLINGNSMMQILRPNWDLNHKCITFLVPTGFRRSPINHFDHIHWQYSGGPSSRHSNWQNYPETVPTITKNPNQDQLHSLSSTQLKIRVILFFNF